MGYIGFHASAAGGVHEAITRGEEKGAEAIQVFTANQRAWNTKSLSSEDVKFFREKRKKSRLKQVITHDSYLINLAGADRVNLNKSRKAFLEEVQRSAALGIDAVVFHPGSFTGSTKKEGINKIAAFLNSVLAKNIKDCPLLLLETTAGSGNQAGGTFDDLADIIKKVKKKDKIGVCFDTAHVFEAGYDLKKNYKKVFSEFNRVIGTARIKAFHVNDSKTEMGSHSDRHGHPGKGKIGREFFKKLMKDRRFKNVPMILETPDEGNMDLKNMNLLKKLRG